MRKMLFKMLKAYFRVSGTTELAVNFHCAFTFHTQCQYNILI